MASLVQRPNPESDPISLGAMWKFVPGLAVGSVAAKMMKDRGYSDAAWLTTGTALAMATMVTQAYLKVRREGRR